MLQLARPRTKPIMPATVELVRTATQETSCFSVIQLARCGLLKKMPEFVAEFIEGRMLVFNEFGCPVGCNGQATILEQDIMRWRYPIECL